MTMIVVKSNNASLAIQRGFELLLKYDLTCWVTSQENGCYAVECLEEDYLAIFGKPKTILS